MMTAYICDYVRTPIGRFGGVLSSVRTDDLAAVPLKALMARHPSLDWAAVDEVIMGCANQAGEDNRNVARMALLLAGLPQSVPGTTVNRLCGSGMDAVIMAARAIKAGEADLIIAGGVESMSRAPFVMPKAAEAFSRAAEIHDTTIGWPRTSRPTTTSPAPTRMPLRSARSSAPLRPRPMAGWPRKSVPSPSRSAREMRSSSPATNIRARPPSKRSRGSQHRSARMAPSRPAMHRASMMVRPRSTSRLKRR
jgi:hypothetical protein